MLWPMRTVLLAYRTPWQSEDDSLADSPVAIPHTMVIGKDDFWAWLIIYFYTVVVSVPLRYIIFVMFMGFFTALIMEFFLALMWTIFFFSSCVFPYYNAQLRCVLSVKTHLTWTFLCFYIIKKDCNFILYQFIWVL